jgi:hypothetical protein
LRNLGHAVQQHLANQKGTFFSTSASGDETWPKVLNRLYVNDWRTFRSPFDRPTSARPKNQNTDPVPVSYGLNEKLFDTIDARWTAPRSLLIVAAAAVDPMSEDGAAASKEVSFKATAFATSNVMISPPGGDGRPTDRPLGTHQRRQVLNVLHADGNVSPMPYHKYADSTTPDGILQWNPQ